jgi:signal transduction histidine kinase
MAEIVNNMLDVTRIDSNVLKLVPENVQISAIMMRVERTFQKGLLERNIALKTDGLSNLPALYLDPDLIFKVFYHLVMNAIKYTPDGGTIRVYGEVIRGNAKVPEVEIVVEDTGVGVANEHREAIFEKFFQTGEVLFHSSGKTKFKGGGPGLGLAIARGIINAHHGRIWVDSPGHDEEKFPGSKFIVRLPMTGGRI